MKMMVCGAFSLKTRGEGYEDLSDVLEDIEALKRGRFCSREEGDGLKLRVLLVFVPQGIGRRLIGPLARACKEAYWLVFFYFFDSRVGWCLIRVMQ